MALLSQVGLNLSIADWPISHWQDEITHKMSVINWFGESFEKDAHALSTMTSDCPHIDESLSNPIGLQARVTELEQQLRRREIEYQVVVEQSHSIVLRWTAQGNVEFVNHYGQQLLGIADTASLEQVLLGKISDEEAMTAPLPTLTLPTLVSQISQTPNGLLQAQVEVSLGDQPYWIQWSHQAIWDDRGEITVILSIGQDLTASKQAEAQIQALFTAQQETQTYLVQSEKMSSLGQLVAGVAHEINNPVNFIHGNITPASQYIEDLLALVDLYQAEYDPPSPEIQAKIEEIDLEFLVADLPKILRSIKVGADRIREIVISLRNFSRLDDSELKPIDLHGAIDGTLLILQNRLKGTDMPKEFSNLPNGTIAVIRDYGTLPPVHCLPGQLNQVFLNILANAIDALESAAEYRVALQTPEAITSYQPTIRIATEVMDSHWVRIRISDNAQGMVEEVRQRIFDPFFTTKPIGKGTGLGMSISHQVVTERHRGQLSCQSMPGEGTEFIIDLPIVFTAS